MSWGSASRVPGPWMGAAKGVLFWGSWTRLVPRTLPTPKLLTLPLGTVVNKALCNVRGWGQCCKSKGLEKGDQRVEELLALEVLTPPLGRLCTSQLLLCPRDPM